MSLSLCEFFSKGNQTRVDITKLLNQINMVALANDPVFQSWWPLAVKLMLIQGIWAEGNGRNPFQRKKNQAFFFQIVEIVI